MRDLWLAGRDLAGIQDRLSHLLRYVSISYPAFRLDYAVQLYYATMLLTHNGELLSEVVGAQPDAYGKVSAQIHAYFDSFTRDTFEMLTDFIRREAWTRLDLSLEDMGGVDSLVGGRRKQRFATKASALLVRLWKRVKRMEKTKDRNMRAFKRYNNPFALIVSVGEKHSSDEEGLEDDGNDSKESDHDNEPRK